MNQNPIVDYVGFEMLSRSQDIEAFACYIRTKVETGDFSDMEETLKELIFMVNEFKVLIQMSGALKNE